MEPDIFNQCFIWLSHVSLDPRETHVTLRPRWEYAGLNNKAYNDNSSSQRFWHKLFINLFTYTQTSLQLHSRNVESYLQLDYSPNMKLNQLEIMFIQIINPSDLTLPVEHEPILEKSLHATIRMILLRGLW